MPDSFEEIANRPSVIRSHWLPLEAAVQEVVTFEQRFGEAHLLLACHAALPALLTPELLHFIRLNFLDQHSPRTSWISEMDLLLSPLCRPLDEELFEVEPMIREALLFELQERYGWSRLQELSQFLLEYLQKMQQSNPDAASARLYEWIAQSYLQPDKVIAELQHILQESLDPQLDTNQTLSKKLQIARTMELIAEPLERTTRPSDYHGLIHSARVLSHVLYTNPESIATTPLSSNNPLSSKQGAAFFPPAVQQWLQTLTTVQAITEPATNTLNISSGEVLKEIGEEKKEIWIEHMLEIAGWSVQDFDNIDLTTASHAVIRKGTWQRRSFEDTSLLPSSMQSISASNKFVKTTNTYMFIIGGAVVGKITLYGNSADDIIINGSRVGDIVINSKTDGGFGDIIINASEVEDIIINGRVNGKVIMYGNNGGNIVINSEVDGEVIIHGNDFNDVIINGRVGGEVIIYGNDIDDIIIKQPNSEIAENENSLASLYGLPQDVFRSNPLPFKYDIIGSDILFTNVLEPKAQSRHVAYFHRPETLEAWLKQTPIYMPTMSPKEWRTHTRWEAATALEKSLADNQPRALIAMPDGTGKTSLLVQMAYRLLTFANARRILYLTHEKQQHSAYTRFEQFRIPGTSERFIERFGIQDSEMPVLNPLPPNIQVWIISIEELAVNMLTDNQEYAHTRQRLQEIVKTMNATQRIAYNPLLPIEAFDFILIDDYDSTTYAKWQPVLDYFDAFIIGTTRHATDQNLNFFNHNLVYNHQITTPPKGKAQWQPLLKPAFLQALAKLPTKDIQLIVDSITLLTQDPLPDGKLKKQINNLSDKPYLIRAGSYRIFYNFNQQYIVLFRIEQRNETTYQGYDIAEDGFDSIDPAAIADRLWSYSEVWAPSEVKTQWSPLLKQEFLQDLAKLPAKDIRLIMDKITLLTQDPSADGNLKRQLQQHPDKLYRLRASSYRIFYTFNQKYILFFKIERRSETTYQDPIMVEEVPDSTELNALAEQLQPYDEVRGQKGIYMGDYLEQLTYLLFLKIEHERSYLSGKRSAHVPIGSDWQSLLYKSGSALIEQYTNILATLSMTRGITGVIFDEADNAFRDPIHLHNLITDYIDKEIWLSMDSQARGAVYSRLLVNMSQGKDGPFNNVPNALASTIIAVMRPEPGMTIGDPACATASLLVEAHTYMTHQTSDPDRLQNALYGYDISTQIASLAAMNLWMHDCIPNDDSSPIIVTNSLHAPPDRQFDMVFCRLPYRVTHLERPLRRADFVAQTSNTQLNFLQHIVSMLKDHGHAAVIVLDETLIEGGTGKQIRADLLETCEVHTLLRLPVGTFYTLANVLFFDSRLREQGDYGTSNKELWVYDLRTSIDLHNIPLAREHFADFVQCYHPQNRQQRTETQRFHKFTYADLLKRKNVNLNITWLLDDITPSANQATRNPARTLHRKFNTWLAEQQSARELPFTDEQISWLKRIRDHIITHGQFTLLDLKRIPFKTDVGQPPVQAIFGAELPAILDDLNQLLM